jgi:O-antigen/teichoic acid export membrane protein
MLRAARSIGFNLVAEFLARAANTIFFIYLTWYASEIDAGRYSLGFTYAIVLLPFALGGSEQLLLREAAYEQRIVPRLLGNLLLARLISSVVCYSGLLAWLELSHSYDSQTSLIIAIAGASSIPENLKGLYQSYLFVCDRVRWSALISAATGFLKLTAGLLVLVLGGGVLGAATILLATSLVSLLAYTIVIARQTTAPVWRFDRSLWRKYGRAGGVFYVLAVVMMLEGSQDILLLAQLVGTLGVGVYAAAGTLTSFFEPLAQGLRQTLLPIITEAYKRHVAQGIGIVAQSLEFILTIGLPIGVSVSAASRQLVALFYQGHFATAEPVLIIRFWALVLLCCAIPHTRLIVAAGHSVVFIPFFIISLALNLMLNLFLQPRYGPEGAAYARLIAAALNCCFGAIYVQMRIQRWRIVQRTWRSIIAGGMMVIALMMLLDIQASLLITLVAAWVVYLTSLWALGVFSLADVRRLSRQVILLMRAQKLRDLVR